MERRNIILKTIILEISAFVKEIGFKIASILK